MALNISHSALCWCLFFYYIKYQMWDKLLFIYTPKSIIDVMSESLNVHKQYYHVKHSICWLGWKPCHPGRPRTSRVLHPSELGVTGRRSSQQQPGRWGLSNGVGVWSGWWNSSSSGQTGIWAPFFLNQDTPSRAAHSLQGFGDRLEWPVNERGMPKTLRPL